ncbi:MAG: lipopolysaccharide transport periplasmic protein LptA [Leptothrix sp. (in: Bacteria)]|nr:lipopolysaccharide transport periplasmic protein LptA [Leptothrix sp. (in: b-proteobacteria)]
MAVQVQAERADSSQPLQFDAGQLRIDGKRRIQWLTGGVELTQGSLRIQAAEVELRDVANGRLALADGGSGGALVTFRQKRDGVDEWIEGQARRVEYDGAAQTVRFLEKAQLRLLRGAVVADQISGELIIYDHNRDVFEVQSGGAGTAAGTRVRGSVAPRPAAAAASAASAPPAGAAR